MAKVILLQNNFAQPLFRRKDRQFTDVMSYHGSVRKVDVVALRKVDIVDVRGKKLSMIRDEMKLYREITLTFTAKISRPLNSREYYLQPKKGVCRSKAQKEVAQHYIL